MRQILILPFTIGGLAKVWDSHLDVEHNRLRMPFTWIILSCLYGLTAVMLIMDEQTAAVFCNINITICVMLGGGAIASSLRGASAVSGIDHVSWIVYVGMIMSVAPSVYGLNKVLSNAREGYILLKTRPTSVVPLFGYISTQWPFMEKNWHLKVSTRIASVILAFLIVGDVEGYDSVVAWFGGYTVVNLLFG